MLKLKTVCLHSVIWILYASFAILVYGYGNIKAAIVETTISYCISAAIFYLHSFYLLPCYFDTKKYALYISGIVCLLFLNFGTRYFFATVLYSLIFGRESSVADAPIAQVILLFSWQWATFMLFSTGFWFANKQISNQKLARKKEIEIAEREKLQLENAALRAQINPHFLINTMDSFRIEAEQALPMMAKAIEALMTFLRSSIIISDPEGKIPLSEEVAAIESLITIFKRRFPAANIIYHKNIREGVRIVPHVLAAFVENSFKHGSFTSKEKDLTISITMRDSDLNLYVHNWKSKRIKDDSRGIGLKYIKRQLDNAFKNAHTLNIIDTDQDYTVDLYIENIISKDEYKLLYH